MKIKKLKFEAMSIYYNLLIQCTVEFSIKLFALNLVLTHSLIIITKRICSWHHFWGSITIMLVVLSPTLTLVDLFVANAGDNFYCNYADGSLLQLCRWYYLQCITHMTVSLVITQVTVSVDGMYMTVSSNNFIFLFLWHLPFIKLTRKHLKVLLDVCISSIVRRGVQSPT